MSTPPERMRITMGLPTLFPRGRETELSWYRKLDEGPWDGLATYDRLLYPHSWSVIPQLAAAAAVTERVRLWTDIVTVPVRNPVLFAKDLATIEVLSGGRVTLGVGIGAWDDDYLAVGAPLEKRRQRMARRWRRCAASGLRNLPWRATIRWGPRRPSPAASRSSPEWSDPKRWPGWRNGLPG